MKNERLVLSMIGGVAIIFTLLFLIIYFSLPDIRNEIMRETAKLLVQAVAIIIVGALVKFSIEQMSSYRDREIALREEKKGFLRAIRGIHHVVLTAPFLIEQGQSVASYQENMLKLFNAAAKLKDLSDDVRSANLEALPDDVRKRHFGAMIKWLNSVVLEGSRESLTDWATVSRLPIFAEYRAAVLKVQDSTDTSSFENSYDQHYEALKEIFRKELGL